jgi:adenylyltransferase/sulfurtransferase
MENYLQIPLGTLMQNLYEINSNKNNIFFCQTGIRSKTAVELLQKHKINNCYSLKGGVSTIINQLKIKI